MDLGSIVRGSSWRPRSVLWLRSADLGLDRDTKTRPQRTGFRPVLNPRASRKKGDPQ